VNLQCEATWIHSVDRQYQEKEDMNFAYLNDLFGIEDKVIAITGGGGVLCSSLAYGLARVGGRIALIDIQEPAAQTEADRITSMGGRAIAVNGNVLERPSLVEAHQKILEAFGKIDILINGAGGNKPEATTNQESTFFDLPIEAIRWVSELNFLGTFLTCQVFGKYMAENGQGIIINIASMNSFRPLTRIPAYSASKAAVVNFTQWLAVHMAQEYSKEIRVNAIAPGFLFTEQNRYLVTDASTGKLTLRGQKIIDHIPQGRFQTPEELISAVIWLISPGASAVTGIVVPIDGGFSAYSGV
jgi:NAD(P)-dependent dehydrogenase (short-subunit alcohol dehydrogenase family)